MSKELVSVIDVTNYMDGTLSNTNRLVVSLHEQDKTGQRGTGWYFLAVGEHVIIYYQSKQLITYSFN